MKRIYIYDEFIASGEGIAFVVMLLLQRDRDFWLPRMGTVMAFISRDGMYRAVPTSPRIYFHQHCSRASRRADMIFQMK